MKHITPMTRLNPPATGQLEDLLAQGILMLFGWLFSDWDNYSQVAQNLRKYYSKI
jgi:hypothetical protein